VAIAINGIIGGGISPAGSVFKLIGSYSLIAFAVCAVVVTLIILCFAEVGSRFDETGGPTCTPARHLAQQSRLRLAG